MEKFNKDGKIVTESLKITYLLNSGFVVSGDGWALLLDDYRDPTQAVDAVLKSEPRFYIFASHAHFDHFNPAIARYAAKASHYFISSDIRALPQARRLPAKKTTWLQKYDGYRDDDIEVTSFDSTDEGTSFLVEIDGWRIFHAGDFNWWHWEDDTPDNIGFARNGFMKQMKHFDGQKFDVVFFPVDGRLGNAKSWGAKEFCCRTYTGALVTMHSVGYPRWKPEVNFFQPGRKIPVWSPTESGETMTLKKGGAFEPVDEPRGD